VDATMKPLIRPIFYTHSIHGHSSVVSEHPSTECVRNRVHAKQDAIHRNGASHSLDTIDEDDK
jgi:hypothetical protein